MRKEWRMLAVCVAQLAVAVTLANIITFALALCFVWLAGQLPSRDVFFTIYVVTAFLLFAGILYLLNRLKPGNRRIDVVSGGNG